MKFCVNNDTVETVGMFYPFDETIEITGITDITKSSIKVVIPETVSIGGIDVPVTAIGDSAFFMRSLSSIDCGNVTTIGESAFMMCPLSSIDCPEVTTVGDFAFSAATNLTTISCPKLEMTGEQSFSICTSLTDIDCRRLRTIGDAAFFECTSLTEIYLPEVEIISDDAFFGCDSLKSIFLGNSLTTIGDGAFRQGSSRLSVTFSGTKAEWNKVSVGSSNSSLTNATIHYWGN